MKNHSMTSTFPGASRTVARAWVLSCLLFAGCQTIPAPPPTPPAAVPPVTAPPPPAAVARPVFTPAAWADVPGWSGDPVEAVWPAFQIGCRALLADAKTKDLWQPPCAASEQIDAANPVAVRAFFESHFIPYRVADADGRDVGRVTGYYEPLLKGSRERTPQFTVPLYSAPDDLLTVDLADLYPELKDKRVRARVDGKKVVPYWTRADIERGAGPVAGKDARVCRRPGRGLLFRNPGFGPHRIGRRLRDSPGICRPERPPVPFDCAGADRPRRPAARTRVDAGHQRVGEGAPQRNARAARRESELRILPRSAARDARIARSAHRRTDRHARRAAARGTHDRRRCARDSAGRARSSSPRRCRCRRLRSRVS